MEEKKETFWKEIFNLGNLIWLLSLIGIYTLLQMHVVNSTPETDQYLIRMYNYFCKPKPQFIGLENVQNTTDQAECARTATYLEKIGYSKVMVNENS